MRITLIHPCVGKLPGEKYIRAWQMEPLPMAQLAALTPDDIQITFWDDRMEDIQYDKPTDLVAISIETYTARRCYEIATEFRKRNIPVIMGGFHATLCPDEVAEYADTVIIGQAERTWENVLKDFKNNRLQKIYKDNELNLGLNNIIPDRSIYKNKNYLKITLLEAGRGCRFRCEFCSVQKFFNGQHEYRNPDVIRNEILQLKKTRKLFFFVDDNIAAHPVQAKELFKMFIPLKIKWVGQADITISRDKELLQLMVASGCQGILIGFESLNIENLKTMNKSFNSLNGGPAEAIRILHKYGLRIYATFLYGYPNDTIEDFNNILKFCLQNKIFMVGFNHLTPFPGTELYERLKKDDLLLYDKWWLDNRYTYGQIPFKTDIPHETIEQHSRKDRKTFYGLSSILYRMTNLTNISGFRILLYYLSINLMLRNDTIQRMRFPLGDKSFTGNLIKVKR